MTGKYWNKFKRRKLQSMKLIGELGQAENVAFEGECYSINGFLHVIIKIKEENDVCHSIVFDHKGNIEKVVMQDRRDYRNAQFVGIVDLSLINLELVRTSKESLS